MRTRSPTSRFIKVRENITFYSTAPIICNYLIPSSIRYSDRCNTEIDCADKSDENTCDYLKYGRNYAKQLIPRDASGTPVTVYLNVSILAFPGM